jgi:uncharacterized protein YdaU (DUF1376 family)
MNYYKKNIGDYAAATRHLSLLEHGVYSLMIDLYYLNESTFQGDVNQVARKIGARSPDEIQAVANVLNDFFVLMDDGWHQKRCDVEIAAYQLKAQTNRIVGLKGGRPIKNPEITQTVSKQNPEETLTSNQEPITNKHSTFAGEPEIFAEAENPPPPENHAPLINHPAPTRKGQLCRHLRELGIDAAPHRLDDSTWQDILEKRTDEEILSFAETKLKANPNKRLSLAYLVPGLLEDAKKTRSARPWVAHRGDNSVVARVRRANPLPGDDLRAYFSGNTYQMGGVQ